MKNKIVKTKVVRKKIGKPCDSCHLFKYSVSTRVDPYSREINNSIIERDLCDACYQLRCDEI